MTDDARRLEKAEQARPMDLLRFATAGSARGLVLILLLRLSFFGFDVGFLGIPWQRPGAAKVSSR